MTYQIIINELSKEEMDPPRICCCFNKNPITHYIDVCDKNNSIITHSLICGECAALAIKYRNNPALIKKRLNDQDEVIVTLIHDNNPSMRLYPEYCYELSKLLHDKPIKELDEYICQMYRDTNVALSGWCVLSSEYLDVLASILKGRKVLDAACGLGMLTSDLRKRYINITGYDNYVDGWDCRWQNPIAVINNDIINDDVLNAPIEEFDTIIMSWPYIENSYDYELAKRLKSGDVLIYIGTFESFTGTDEFKDYLQDSFTLDLDKTAKLMMNHYDYDFITTKTYYYIKN